MGVAGHGQIAVDGQRAVDRDAPVRCPVGVLRCLASAAVCPGAGFIAVFDDVGRLQGQRPGGLNRSVAPGLDGRVPPDFHGPVFGRYGQKRAVLFDFQAHARRLLNDEFVQAAVRRAVRLPAEIGNSRIVRVAVVIREVAQRAYGGRADDAPFRPAPHDGDFHLRNHRLRLIRAFVVA